MFNKIVLVSSLAVLGACGSREGQLSDTSSENDNVISFQVRDSTKLPTCTEKRQGSIALVREEQRFYVCEVSDGLAGWTPGVSIADLKGEKGVDGVNGIDGLSGAQGDKGGQGEKGEKGEKGDTGSQGAQGEKGDTGSQGAQGEKGDTGFQGAQGVAGVDNHITKFFECTVDMSDNPHVYDIWNNSYLIFKYKASVTSYGDVFASTYLTLTPNAIKPATWSLPSSAIPKPIADSTQSYWSYQSDFSQRSAGGTEYTSLFEARLNQTEETLSFTLTDLDQDTLPDGVYARTVTCTVSTY